jgi:LacI family transcriptional regulator
MATLKDLSRALGLSVTQVSRALNGHGDVNEETRARVMQAAQKLNYHPNLSARKLATGRSGIVGLVLPDVPFALADSLFVHQVGGLSRAFSARGIQFVLHMADPKDDMVRVHERLINSGSLDGFVLLDPQIEDARIDYLRKRGVPFVLHGRHEAQPDYPFYDIDNFEVGYRLTRILTDQGHRRIAILNGVRRRSYTDARLAGYHKALAEVGLAPDPALHLAQDMSEGFGLVSAVRLWSPDGPRPSAVICGNLLIAKGVFQGLAALGLSVPGDVSLVAHDDALPGLSAAALPVPVTATFSALSSAWEPLAAALVGAIEGRAIHELQTCGALDLRPGASVATVALPS